jgi:iron complex transport system substrate-binding protein
VRALDEITGIIVDSALRIHRDLGPGLLESVYEVILARALTKRGLQVLCQQPITFDYDGVVFEEGFRVDMLIESQVLVELKSVEKHAPVHARQLLTYLRLTRLRVGLLINFGAPSFKEGVRRVVNDPASSAAPRLCAKLRGLHGDD